MEAVKIPKLLVGRGDMAHILSPYPKPMPAPTPAISLNAMNNKCPAMTRDMTFAQAITKQPTNTHFLRSAIVLLLVKSEPAKNPMSSIDARRLSALAPSPYPRASAPRIEGIQSTAAIIVIPINMPAYIWRCGTAVESGCIVLGAIGAAHHSCRRVSVTGVHTAIRKPQISRKNTEWLPFALSRNRMCQGPRLRRPRLCYGDYLRPSDDRLN
jgi:hypothetical protein